MGLVIHIDTRQLDITPFFFPDRISCQRKSRQDFLSEKIQTGNPDRISCQSLSEKILTGNPDRISCQSLSEY